ncbi:MAG TPA: ABC transporter ATP-binding protein [Chloroflexota bacterium]|nr:ABC transporter ATP-binding protein [Chloroflexota bacterium]
MDVLTVRDIHKSFGRRTILQGVGLSVAAGTLVGIVGENGSGKSTLLRILAGELRPDRGDITRIGATGYCPQTVVLNDALTVSQHIAYFWAAYGLHDRERADELIHILGYEQYLGSRVAALSGGTRQKLNLTLALMHEPSLLLLDEPYQGFDWETYLRFWHLADSLRERGAAILIISHLVFEQERFDRLYRLEGGTVRDDTLVPA